MLANLLCIVASITLAINVPPAAKTLAVLVFVYGILQVLKMSTVLAPYITGWKAFALNALLSLGGMLVVIPADQLYSWSTLGTTITEWLTVVLGAAGIHGTTSKL